MNNANQDKIEKQLSKRGLRLAASDEAGWYVVVWVGRETKSVWVTEKVVDETGK